MGFKDALEDVSRYRNAYTIALAASMGSIFFGWDTGLMGGILTMKSFQHYFGIDKLSASAKANFNGNIVSVMQAGCIFGVLLTSWASSRFGRKRSLIASGLIYIIGSVIQAVAGLGSSQAVALNVLYFSRVFAGIGVGMVSALAPSYISECMPRHIRGRCTGLVQFSDNIGMMLSFWVNYSASINIPSSDMQWRMPLIVQLVPGILFVLLMIPQPESPRWLVEQERYDEAAKTLAYIVRTSVDDKSVLVTLDEIKADFVGRQRTSLVTQFRMMGESRQTALRCLIPSILTFFQQWTGTNAINYFSPQIFAALGITGTSSGLFATGIYGLVKVVAVGLTLAFAVESWGRKLCLFVGGIGQGLTMLWIGGFGALHPQSTIVPASYVSIISVYLYAVFYCIGWGPLPWVVASEVAPNHVRAAALTVAVSVNWLFSFTISRLTPVMLENITYGTFLLFGLCCMIMAAWAYFFLPETKGYALEDIKYLFEKDVIVRSLQDAPGGRLFLGGKRATPVEEMRGGADLPDSSDSSRKGDEEECIEVSEFQI
ncbi:general substrate transporter [Suillus clintonianus]|uniref:general substrate transporter n=1 Tax=Suillus clintonianus TaxID=1904413 RepID=UPI001B876276|nr:general substrate transporter [Suillus clintonianus]KAG2132962.1 general substrate transporter [Suillus clintonianus]